MSTTSMLIACNLRRSIIATRVRERIVRRARVCSRREYVSTPIVFQCERVNPLIDPIYIARLVSVDKFRDVIWRDIKTTSYKRTRAASARAARDGVVLSADPRSSHLASVRLIAYLARSGRPLYMARNT